MRSEQERKKTDQRFGPLASGKLRTLALPLALAAMLALCPASAIAAKTHHLKTTIPSAIYLGGVAVDEASDNVFAATFNSPTFGVRISGVDIFGPQGGSPSGIDPPYRIEGFDWDAGPGAIAIDNSAISPSKGALYVSAAGNTVKKFVLVGQKYELKEELSASPAFTSTYGIAVDSKGNVFVADPAGDVVVVFGPEGVQSARFDLSASVGHPASIAVDSAGDLFMVAANEVYRFPANGLGEIDPGTEPEQITGPELASTGALGVAAVDVNGESSLYVADQVSVSQYDASCETEGEGEAEHCNSEGNFGRGVLNHASHSLAINSKTGDVYAGDSVGSHDRIVVFGPTVIVPGAVTGEATDVTGISATLSGSVDPAGSELEECKFEWGPSTAYGQTAPCAESPGEIGSGTTPKAVHAELSGLALGRTYHFRLVATSPTTVPDEQGPAIGSDDEFTTLGPRVQAESVSQVGDTTAKLEGLVNPVGQATSYVFQHVSAADFSESEYAKAISQPLGGEAIGAGNEDVAVAQVLSGLTPSTTYHFRLVATNHCNPDPEEECVAAGPGGTFTTFIEASPRLPDGRVYEQVTPVDKNGAAPGGGVGSVYAAPNGNRITFASAGAIMPGSEGAQEYPAYLASRGSDWSSRGLLPAASAGSVANVRGWSEDLSRAYVVQASKPQAPGGFLQRESASGSIRAIATEADAAAEFHYVDGAADNSVVVFESNSVLSPGGAAKAFNTYAWDSATGELSLVGGFNNGLPPAKGSLAGSNQSAEHRHYTQAQHTVSSDGSHVFFSDAGTGQLYVRLNPTRPQSELDGAGKCTEADLACTVHVSASQRAIPDPKGKKPAVFWGAIPDGSKAFFTSPGKLTDDATTGPNDEGNDLYRYDVQSEELTDLTPDASDPAGAEVRGVLGASDDGSYVYFAANAPLAGGATQGNCSLPGPSSVGTCNVYLWHEGSVTFIAQLQNDSTNWASSAVTEKTARVTPDGQTLLFRSTKKLTDYDNEGVPQLYLYSASSGEIVCVSCSPVGQPPLGAARLRSIALGKVFLAPTSTLTHNLSLDGNRVFFDTPDKLVIADTNGDQGCPPVPNAQGVLACQDVYEWEAKGTGSCESEGQNGGCLYLLSSGTGTSASYLADASANGDDAFFFTDHALVGQDQDQIVDIYDARVGGGIASQNSSPPNPCSSSESCRTTTAPPPPGQTPGTANFSGPSNSKPCKQGRVKKRGRCVKKSRAHKRKKSHRKRHATKKRG